MSDPLQNPYPGPEPFGIPGSSTSKCGFFGRDAEKPRLGYTILGNPVVVLYASSGAGKTSLINAGLIPWLEAAGTNVIVSPRLRQVTTVDEEPDDGNNVFVDLAIDSIKRGYRSPGNGPSHSPVLDGAGTEGALHSYIRSLYRNPSDPKEITVLIFDQFEEIFDLHDAFWQQRKGFFEQVNQAVRDLQRLHVVFVVREEYLAKIASYAPYLLGNLEARFYVEPLRDKAALDAIYKPAENSIRPWRRSGAEWLNKKLFVEAADEQRNVERQKEFVDATILQIVCHDLWEKAKKEQMTDIDEQWLAKQDSEVSLLDNCLSNFYLKQLKAAACIKIKEDAVAKQVLPEQELSMEPDVVDFLEGLTNMQVVEEMEKLGGWIERKLIEGDKRKLHVWYRDRSSVPFDALDELKKNHLIHARQSEDAQQVIELSHDRLVKVIQEENERLRLALTGLRFGQKNGMITEKAINDFINQTAYYISREEKRKYISDADVDFLYSKVAPPDYNLDHTCYVWARAHFSLATLEGRPSFEKVLPESFKHLEFTLLADAKKIKAYLVWKRRGGYKGEDLKNYFEVCDRFRKKALDDKAKLSLKDFQKVKEYIQREYLTEGKLDDQKEQCHRLLNYKAGDIWLMLGKTETSETHWNTARTTAALFYENIIAAVETNHEESLENLQTLFARHRPVCGPLQRADLLDCFQAAVVMSFLKPSIISRYRLLI